MKLTLITLLTFTLASFTLQKGKYNSRMIIELFRTGARAPIKNTLNEAWVNTVGPGYLTSNGERQHYILGKKLRSEYPKLFKNDPNSFKKDEFMMYSSSFQRSILSAQAHLQGLFPPGTGLEITATSQTDTAGSKFITPPFEGLSAKEKIIEDAKFEKFSLPNGMNQVPVYILDYSTDNVFFKGSHLKQVCLEGHTKVLVNFKEFLKDPKSSKLVEKTITELKKAGFSASQMYKTADKRLLQENTAGGFDLESAGYFSDLVLSNQNHKANGESGIPNLSSNILKLMKDTYGIFYHFYKYGGQDDMVKAHLTGVMELIVSHVEGKIHEASNGEAKVGRDYFDNFKQTFKFNKAQSMKNLKYVGLSGHQSNIYALFTKLGLSTVSCMSERLNGKIDPTKTCLETPDFASNIIFELSQRDTDDSWWIRARFNGGSWLRICDVPGEEKRCHIQSFRSYVEENLILNKADYKTFCGLGVGSNIVWSLIACVLVFTILVMGFFLIILVRKVQALRRAIPMLMAGERPDISVDNVMLEY